MAPESERANDDQREDWCPECRRVHQFNEDCKPKEPTLTCSEVVERLRKECFPNGGYTLLNFAQAEKILDEWRERRVQELEEALQKYGRHLVTCPHLSENMRSNSDCNCGWEKLLAKHSLTPEPQSTQLDTGKEK